jgi:hypothetical protein
MGLETPMTRYSGMHSSSCHPLYYSSPSLALKRCCGTQMQCWRSWLPQTLPQQRSQTFRYTDNSHGQNDFQAILLQHAKGMMIEAEDHFLTGVLKAVRNTKQTCYIEIQLCGSSQGTTTNDGYKRQIHR